MPTSSKGKITLFLRVYEFPLTERPTWRDLNDGDLQVQLPDLCAGTARPFQGPTLP